MLSPQICIFIGLTASPVIIFVIVIVLIVICLFRLGSTNLFIGQILRSILSFAAIQYLFLLGSYVVGRKHLQTTVNELNVAVFQQGFIYKNRQ